MVFYRVGTRGTIRPHPKLNLEEACIKLNDAMEGLGTDERTMNDVILSYSFQQRKDIIKTYQNIYDRNLIRQMESELTFTYEQIVLALMSDPQEYILDCIHEAVTLSFGEGIMKKFQKATFKKGIAQDEYTLLGLLLPRANAELTELKKAYKKKYKKHLERQIATSENLSLDFRRLIIAMIDCKRDENSKVDGDLILKDVMCLVSNKKEEHVHVVFHERSFTHLRKLFAGYEDLTGKPLEDLIEKSHFTLDLKEAYIALITLLRNEAEYFAERLHDAIDGAGTDDDTLIQVMVLRSEMDLVDIMLEYEKKYDDTLETDIKGDTSGDYEDLLIKMLRVPEDVREGFNAERGRDLVEVEDEESEQEEDDDEDDEEEESEDDDE